MIGSTLQNRYRIESQLGSGGMGTVYRARDTLLDRPVAIKLLSDGRIDSDARARWLREAQAAARLQNPHVVAVFDAGEANGSAFIVMEYVEGKTLRDAGPLSLAEIIEIGRQVCDGLAHAHENGIIHRDVKPENVLVQRIGGEITAKLADLGVARISKGTRVTTEGALIGTANYLAPEQALGVELDGRADLYSLGVVLYEQVAGRLPFAGDDPLAVVSQHLHAPIVPPRTYRADLASSLEAVILRSMAKTPEGRFGSARELEAALAAVDLNEYSKDATAATSSGIALLEQLARGRLVGRRAELEQLRELWRRALAGNGHMALVSGEPGIGKTRLVRELIVYAQLYGANVLTGGCYEFEATTPYLPFVEALRHWVDSQDTETLRRRLGANAAVLARLAPRIDARLGPFPPLPPLGAQEERLRLFDAAAQFFQGLAAERGLLLVLDDLHWADHGTITLLHYLLRNLRSERILLLGAYREVELDRAHPLGTALIEWNRERLATRIPLGRLNAGDTGRMLGAMFGQEDVTPDFAEAMFRETEGNPFFAEEVVKTLVEHGQIYHEGGAWHRRDVAELTIPQSVKAAIGRRLERLSQPCVDVLHTAAALGKVFEFGELVAVTSTGEEQLLDALDEASAAQLVRPDRGDTFAFTHDKIREVLHEELNPIRQRRLHQRIAESLEKLYAGSLGDHVEDLAYHFAESSDLEKGLAYSLAAAEQAEKVFAHEEALSFLDRARECAEGLERTSAIAEVNERIGRVHSHRGQFNTAVEYFQRALALTTDPRKRSAIKGEIGELRTRVGDPRGLAFLEEALAELDPETQVRELALTLANIGRYHHYLAQHHKSKEFLERAGKLAESIDDADVLSLVYGYLAGAYQHLARFEESNEWSRRNIELGQRRGRPQSEAQGYEFIAENANNLGRWREAVDYGGRDQECGRRCGSQDRVAWGGFAIAWGYLEGGELAYAQAVASESLALAQRIGEGRLAIWLDAVLAQVEINLGLVEQGRKRAEDSDKRAEAIKQMIMQCAANRPLAYALTLMGDAQGAAERCEKCLALGEGTDNKVYLIITLGPYVEALLALGRLDEAAKWAKRGLDLMKESGSLLVGGDLMWYEGVRLSMSGDQEGAERQLDEAIAVLEKAELRLKIARALHARADVRRKRGNTAGAHADLERAYDIFGHCGAVPERDAVAAELKR
jgi:tetratricopeptide (TPR) repeat protein